MGFLGGALDSISDALDGVGSSIDDVVDSIFGETDWGEVFKVGSDALKQVMAGGASGQMEAYRSMATNAYRPGQMPVSDIQPPGTNKVLNSVDAQAMHDRWMSRMRDFAYLKGIHEVK